jgi:bifunctional DNA-binding transcriptional regulator/antitoxin component of YhaV-PrlF toxin-antitoxin module
MKSGSQVIIRERGNITLPVELRKKYLLEEGDVYYIIDLGDGDFLLSSGFSKVNQLGKQISDLMETCHLNGDDLIKSLDEEREKYYQEHYAKE